MLRDFMRDPRAHMKRAGDMNRSGGFAHSNPADTPTDREPVDDGGFDSPYNNQRSSRDMDVDVERQKKLYFDQESGRFFFK